MATQSTLRNTRASSRTPLSPPSYKGPSVGFISPQAKAIFRYTQMADTPKICTNGLFDQNDNPNSSSYFNRVRKQSAGRTPFAIFDDRSVPTTQSSASSSNNSTDVDVDSPSSTDAVPPFDLYLKHVADTPKMSNNNNAHGQSTNSNSTNYRRKLDFPKKKANKKVTTTTTAAAPSTHPMSLRRPRKNQS